MDKEELVERIMQKPELKELPKEDIEMAFSLCFKKEYSDREQIKCTREILHRAYGAFGSRKLLVTSSNPGQSKERNPEWILRKHLSTRERLPYYPEIYDRILKDFNGTIFDLGAGVNGFSLNFIPNVKYLGIEGVGQLVNLMNDYFEKQKFNAKAIHLSLFNLEKLKKIIKQEKGKKIIFLFKVLDSLECLKKDYSKEFLLEISSLADKVAVSFATRSMISKRPFKAKRNWIINFIRDNFKILDEFEKGGEKYICFAKF
jgi:hypothetical protein